MLRKYKRKAKRLHGYLYKEIRDGYFGLEGCSKKNITNGRGDSAGCCKIKVRVDTV